MKIFKTLNSILTVICFLAVNTGPLFAQQWIQSSESPNQYQAVKPYIPEEDPNAKTEDKLTGSEKEKIAATTESALKQMEAMNSIECQARVSDSMEKRAFVGGNDKSDNGKNQIVAIDPTTPSVTSPVGQHAQNPLPSNPPPDALGFLAMQNDSPLQRVGKTDSEKKNLLKNMDAQAQNAVADPAVSVNPIAVQVVDSVQFNDKVRMVYELMNPPGDLHPWLKWLLYSNRVTKDMVVFYNETLKKRDNLYQKALTSNGKLAIMYRNRIFKDIPLYVMPEWANGDYSLVSVGMETNFNKDLSVAVSSQVPIS